METGIQEIERKMKVMQKMVDSTKDEKQKAFFQNSLTNAGQMMANFREVERILQKSGGQQGD